MPGLFSARSGRVAHSVLRNSPLPVPRSLFLVCNAFSYSFWTFDAMVKHLTPGALVELHLAIGFYIMTSKFLETFGVDMQT